MIFPRCPICGSLPSGPWDLRRVVYNCGMTATVEPDEVFYFILYRGCSMVLDTDYFFVVRENKLRVEEGSEERTHQKV